MTRYLALASHAERSGDVQQSAGATVAVAQIMAGFMRVGIVDRAMGATGNGNSCDVPKLILGDGSRSSVLSSSHAMQSRKPVLQRPHLINARVGSGSASAGIWLRELRSAVSFSG